METIINQYRQRVMLAAKKHGILNVRVFGSMARGDATSNSDIDFLVDLEKNRDLFDLGAFQLDMQDLFHRKVDVVTETSLHIKLHDSIMLEAKPL